MCLNIVVFVKSGVMYVNVYMLGLLDLFLGFVVLVMGGLLKMVGLFYDVLYDCNLYVLSDIMCLGKQGWNVVFDEMIGIDVQNGGVFVYFDGGGVFNLQVILYVKVNGQCVLVYLYNYVKINMVFEVVKVGVLNVCIVWVDKYVWGYDWLNGWLGIGVDDLMCIEINLIDLVINIVYIDVYLYIVCFDNLYVQVLINQIGGCDLIGMKIVLVLMLFGMNFQMLSVVQKVLVVKGGGYFDVDFMLNGQVVNVIMYVDDVIGYVVVVLKQVNLYLLMVVIVMLKYGQLLSDYMKFVKNGDMLMKLFEVNNFFDLNGNFGQNNMMMGNLNDGLGLVGMGFVQIDDVGLIWFCDCSQCMVVVQMLKVNFGCNVLGICVDGLQVYVLYGVVFVECFGDLVNGCMLDIVVQLNLGVIYMLSMKKDEEYGGNVLDDSYFGLFVLYLGIYCVCMVNDFVGMKQVVLMIFVLFGVDLCLLQVVVVENMCVLLGFGIGC